MAATGLRGVQVSLAPGWDILLGGKLEAGWGQPSWGPPRPLHTPAVCSSNPCSVCSPPEAPVLGGTNFRSGRALAWLSSLLLGLGLHRCRSCRCLVTKLYLTPSDPMDYIAHQAPLSMGFSKQQYCSGSPFPSPGDLPDPGIELASPAFVVRFFRAESPEKTKMQKTDAIFLALFRKYGQWSL